LGQLRTTGYVNSVLTFSNVRTIRSLLQTLPVFSNGLSMLKATYFDTLYVMAILKSINIFGEKFRDRHVVLLMGRELGSMRVLLDPKDVTGYLKIALFVRY